MKNTIKTTVCIALALVMLMGIATTAYAASLYFPYNSSRKMDIDGQWRTIAYSTDGGFNCEVVIAATTKFDGNFDIQMLGASNNRLWYEENSLSSFYPRTYQCGSDVYEIQIRSTNGEAGSGWAGNAGPID